MRKAVLADGTVRKLPEHMSLAEFESIPFKESDRWELIEGEPILTPSPEYRHQELLGVLQEYLRGRSLSMKRRCRAVDGFDLRAPESSSYVCPDLIALPESELAHDQSRPFKGVPALVVESLSPSSHVLDMVDKQEIYRRRKTPEYWVVDPLTGAVFAFVLGKDGSYEQQRADDDGYVISPFCAQALRILPHGLSYEILTKNVRKTS